MEIPGKNANKIVSQLTVGGKPVMTSAELARRIDLTQANLSILKTGKAKAIRWSTLEALCRELNCQPGDLLEYVPDESVAR